MLTSVWGATSCRQHLPCGPIVFQLHPTNMRPEEVSKHTDSNQPVRVSIDVRGQCQAERESSRERAPSRPSLRVRSLCVVVCVRYCVHLSRPVSVSGPPHVCVAMGGTMREPNVERTWAEKEMEGHAFHGPCDCGPSEPVFGVVRSLSVRVGASSSCAVVSRVCKRKRLCTIFLQTPGVGKPCAASTIIGNV